MPYQSVLGYFSSHYQPSIILAKEPSAELIMKLLRVSAGLSVPTDSQKHLVSRVGALKGSVFFRIVAALVLLRTGSNPVTARLKKIEDLCHFVCPDFLVLIILLG